MQAYTMLAPRAAAQVLSPEAVNDAGVIANMTGLLALQ